MFPIEQTLATLNGIKRTIDRLTVDVDFGDYWIIDVEYGDFWTQRNGINGYRNLQRSLLCIPGSIEQRSLIDGLGTSFKRIKEERRLTRGSYLQLKSQLIGLSQWIRRCAIAA